MYKKITVFILLSLILGILASPSFFNTDYSHCPANGPCSPLHIFDLQRFSLNILFILISSVAITFLFFSKIKIRWMIKLPAIYVILSFLFFTSLISLNDMGILWALISPGILLPELYKEIVNHGIQGSTEFKMIIANAMSVLAWFLIGHVIDWIIKRKNKNFNRA